MSFESRLAALVAAIGADIKELKARPAGASAAPYFLASTDTYSVAQNKQVPFGTTIDNEGILDVEGILEEV